jgi:Sulfotransferase family
MQEILPANPAGRRTQAARQYQPPVFVLTASRSGSTLLRFILDSHPDLACPPETSIASACAALARSWHILENADSGHARLGAQPAMISPQVADAVREAIDQIYGHYLQGRGKRRWCDKSLDSYQFADLVAEIYPDARFICLFRHCMDVIASGVEACPWGLHRFGFDPHVAQYPGNSVAAIGSYWLSCAQAIIGFQEAHPEVCHRVRYEDLVTDPEGTAAAIFDFLGAAPAPGIPETSFRTAHEAGGPGDEKIWFTGGVTSGSVGRGLSVPAAALPSALAEAVNETLTKLGYRVVDEQWNDAVGPTDPRAQSAPAPPADGPAGPEEDKLKAAVDALAERVEAGGPAMLRDVSTCWPKVAGTVVSLIVQAADGHNEKLLVEFPPQAEPGEPAAMIIASPATWLALLGGQANPVTEITAGRLRCINRLETHRIRSDALHAVGTILGWAQIPTTRTPGSASCHHERPGSAAAITTQLANGATLG